MGYYARFLEVFPTVDALAAADEERLMKLWEGLGYYSRARNLQKAAQEIVKLGSFPDTYEGLLALPGIGDYTASAIAAAAFGQSGTGSGRQCASGSDPADGLPRRYSGCGDKAEHPGGAVGSDAGIRGGRSNFQSGHDGTGGHPLRPQHRAAVRRLPGAEPLSGTSAGNCGRIAGEKAEEGTADGGENRVPADPGWENRPAEAAQNRPAGRALGVSQCGGRSE